MIRELRFQLHNLLTVAVLYAVFSPFGSILKAMVLQ